MAKHSGQRIGLEIPSQKKQRVAGQRGSAVWGQSRARDPRGNANRDEIRQHATSVHPESRQSARWLERSRQPRRGSSLKYADV